MALIEGLRVQNYRVFRDVTLGKLSDTQQGDPLTPFTVVMWKADIAYPAFSRFWKSETSFRISSNVGTSP